MSEPSGSEHKQRQCHKCGAWLDRLAMQCPQCGEELPVLGDSRRSVHGRRYVYGKRKPHLSQETIWLLVVIAVGLLIALMVQLLAYMRASKALMAPPVRPTAICRLDPCAHVRAGRPDTLDEMVTANPPVGQAACKRSQSALPPAGGPVTPAARWCSEASALSVTHCPCRYLRRLVG